MSEARPSDYSRPSDLSQPSESASKPIVGMIWAQTLDGVIGAAGTMPWRVPEDMEHFKRTTMGHPVVMGRRTWESFPTAFRPLPGRTNIVLSSDPQWAAKPEAAGAIQVATLPAALTVAHDSPGAEEIWIVGGGQVYTQALPLADLAVVTVVELTVPGDTKAPELGPEWTLQRSDPAEGWHESRTGTRYRFEWWSR